MEFDWLKGFAHMLRGKSREAVGKFGLALIDFKEVLKMDSYYPELEEARKRIKEIEERNKE